jgi:hypothetical protein
MFECIICLNEYRDFWKEELSCKHLLCKTCYKRWLLTCLRKNKKLNCPMCRKDDIKEEEIIIDDFYYSRFTKYNIK